MIRRHLIEQGFDKEYTCWDFHGESKVDSHTFVSNTNREENDNSNNHHHDIIDEMLRDVERDVAEKDIKKLQLFVDAEKPLYSGCKKFTILSIVVKLWEIKAKNGWSDRSFTTLLKLLHEAFLKDNELPVSTYQAKKMMCLMGLEVERIHACPNDCILFRNGYKDLHECPICNESRFQGTNNRGCTCYDPIVRIDLRVNEMKMKSNRNSGGGGKVSPKWIITASLVLF
ncbi:hypothetical protein Tco_1243456 [Tanacetum coccineum]